MLISSNILSDAIVVYAGLDRTIVIGVVIVAGVIGVANGIVVLRLVLSAIGCKDGIVLWVFQAQGCGRP